MGWLDASAHHTSVSQEMPASYLSSMAALGYNPLVAIQIALAGNAADMIKMHDPKTAPIEGRVDGDLAAPRLPGRCFLPLIPCRLVRDDPHVVESGDTRSRPVTSHRSQWRPTKAGA